MFSCSLHTPLVGIYLGTAQVSNLCLTTSTLLGILQASERLFRQTLYGFEGLHVKYSRPYVDNGAERCEKDRSEQRSEKPCSGALVTSREISVRANAPLPCEARFCLLHVVRGERYAAASMAERDITQSSGSILTGGEEMEGKYKTSISVGGS